MISSKIQCKFRDCCPGHVVPISSNTDRAEMIANSMAKNLTPNPVDASILQSSLELIDFYLTMHHLTPQ